jgi:hypothetical protein
LGVLKLGRVASRSVASALFAMQATFLCAPRADARTIAIGIAAVCVAVVVVRGAVMPNEDDALIGVFCLPKPGDEGSVSCGLGSSRSCGGMDAGGVLLVRMCGADRQSGFCTDESRSERDAQSAALCRDRRNRARAAKAAAAVGVARIGEVQEDGDMPLREQCVDSGESTAK